MGLYVFRRLLEDSERRTVDGGLTGQLLEHLGGTSEPIARLADRNVQDELLDAELPHGVGGLLRLHGELDEPVNNEGIGCLGAHTMMMDCCRRLAGRWLTDTNCEVQNLN